jgi:hypothetical protein
LIFGTSKNLTERGSTQLGSLLDVQELKLSTEKHSSLLIQNVGYEEKKSFITLKLVAPEAGTHRSGLGHRRPFQSTEVQRRRRRRRRRRRLGTASRLPRRSTWSTR